MIKRVHCLAERTEEASIGPVTTLSEQAAELPTASGVYLFRARGGGVLYVGKAVNLRARVRQYIAGQDGRTMVPFLVSQARSVEVVITDTEKEALLLENTLIKKHRPRFNVKLRDDSNFLHARIDTRLTWPRYQLVRRIKDDGARYFGPYASASRGRKTLEFMHRAFPLRTCTDQVLASRRRPCLLHQMGRCVAPCVDGTTSREEYAELVEGSLELLAGRRQKVIERLRQRMFRHAHALEYERAARVRDLVFSIETSIERQKVVDTRLGDRDIWGLYREGIKGAVAIVPVREGVMGEPRSHALEAALGDDPELLSSLINAAYQGSAPIPREILVPAMPPDAAALAEVLTERRGAKVILRAPQRGDKVRLVALAAENARVRYLAATDENQRHQDAMVELARVLELATPPHRIECFDNSNLQGTNPVAAMAVFLDGRPARREYRRYKIKTVVGADDYASMREILERRIKRARKDGNTPDLILVDGGKGQLGVATAVLQDLGVHDLPVAGIAKPRTERRQGDRRATDKIVLPHRKDPLRLAAGHPGLRILQHIRDEVHKHAIRYHRSKRRQDALVSVLEGIDGVGPARRRALLRTLGSAEGVASASAEELTAVPGIGPGLATTIRSVFDGG